MQLPEPCAEKSEAYQAGYRTIADICKERLRRAGRKIQEENPDKNLDVGFRVLKIDSSCLTQVAQTPNTLTQETLFKGIETLKPDRNGEDLFFQVLIMLGLDLSLPLTRESLAGKLIFWGDKPTLAACFETGLSEEFCKDLAKEQPQRVVFCDHGFASDAVKINVSQIFERLSPHTIITLL